MKLSMYTVSLKKKYPLQISRGIKDQSVNVFLKIKEGNFTAWGESAPGESENAGSAETVKEHLQNFISTDIKSKSIYELYNRSLEMNIPPCAYASLDMALWDLMAKKANKPLYKYLGLPKPSQPTSVTIGINPVDIIRERIPLILKDNKFKSLKVKLGNPLGIDADKEMFNEVYEISKNYDVKIRVDANGGWDVNQTLDMMDWLNEREVDYIEQPIKEGDESDLKYIFERRKMPIYLDESCRYAKQIPLWAKYVDGINLKLMKCGGITEGLKIINTARAHGLKTMIGCMSESSVSIAASASISGIIDYIDLDSHYNLNPDPSTGTNLIDGITSLSDNPGHGGELKKIYYA
tara:strand:- start:230 stop:1279 length:1050 start_codon:yes stop_codon:yes gene_type:complete